MGRFEDKTGRRYGRWTVIGLAERICGRLAWQCVCDCGTQKAVLSQNLANGSSRSCGCFNREEASKRMKQFLHRDYETGTRLYETWKNMRNRCRPGNKNANRYFDRGITVCDEWNDYKKFHDWAMDNGYSDSLTLDRVDNDKGYSPENCRFVSQTVQSNNRDVNHRIVIYGTTYTIAEAARKFGINYGTLKTRVKSGLKDGDLISPVRKNELYGIYKGKRMRAFDIARISGLAESTVSNRIKKGIPLDKPADERFRAMRMNRKS